MTKETEFIKAIKDFGIEATLEYFSVKESDKQYFRNEWERTVALPISSASDYDLRFCDKCFQMTNHENNVCLKCKQESIIPPIRLPALSSASEYRDMIEKAKSLFMVFQKILTDYGLVEWGQLKCAKEITIACTNEIMKALDNLPRTQYTKEIDEEANRWADIQQHIKKI